VFALLMFNAKSAYLLYCVKLSKLMYIADKMYSMLQFSWLFRSNCVTFYCRGWTFLARWIYFE